MAHLIPFIIDVPILKNGGSFHSYVNVYQRVMQQVFFGLLQVRQSDAACRCGRSSEAMSTAWQRRTEQAMGFKIR